MKRQRGNIVFGWLLVGTGFASLANATYLIVAGYHVSVVLVSVFAGLTALVAGVLTLSSDKER